MAQGKQIDVKAIDNATAPIRSVQRELVISTLKTETYFLDIGGVLSWVKSPERASNIVRAETAAGNELMQKNQNAMLRSISGGRVFAHVSADGVIWAGTPAEKQADDLPVYTPPNKFDVHVYFVVRHKFQNVTADSKADAVRRAKESFSADDALEAGVDDAEELTGFMVDVHGDSDYERTEFFDANGKPSPLPIQTVEQTQIAYAALLQFASMIARMKPVTIDASDDSLEDNCATINGLIQEACKLTGIEPADDDDSTDCRKCGEPADNGEGWNGLCGGCADRSEESTDDA